MIVTEKNQGEKIPYKVVGTKITFDEELMLDLSYYAHEDPNHVDICRDKNGNLICGVIPGIAERYNAQIDIPGRDYDYIDGGFDRDGNPTGTKIPLPFDMNKCTLTLWALL